MKSDISPLVEIKDVLFQYHQTEVLGPLSLEISANETLAIVGPSGCGKTTLLKLLAGILDPSGGSVLRHFAAATRGKPSEVGFAFQAPDLIPWLNVVDNVLLPLKLCGAKVSEADMVRCDQLLNELELQKDAKRMPAQLSGGMKRRVGIARSLISDPTVLFLDEPFGEIDEVLRRRLMLWLSEHIARSGMGCAMVTHSLEEAIFLSNRIIVLSKSPGKVVGEIEIDRALNRDMNFHSTEAYAGYESKLGDLLQDGRKK